MPSLNDHAVTLAELAELMGKPEAYLQRHWKKLHEKHGFPRKLSIGWLWPRRSVEAFLQATEAAAPVDPQSPPATLAANQNRLLSGRYAGGRA